MKKTLFSYLLPALLVLAFSGLLPTSVLQASASTTAHMTVTLRVLGDNKRTPEVKREDVFVKQGDNRLRVTGWTPASGDHAGLDLFILIDDGLEPTVASRFDEVRAFINGLPASTSVGVGYMRNGTVQITQNFTADHSQAAKALRLPIASSGVFASPWLSVVDLMKRWPKTANRREVIMVTDGIDRFRGGPHYRGFVYISPDVDTAISVAQHTGTIIDTIFARGVGRLGRNYWEITNGQNGMGKLSDETGGEFYYLGTQTPVSFQPYLDNLKTALDNQYLLEFEANPGKKSELQYVNLSTEVAGVELDAADRVWVEAK